MVAFRLELFYKTSNELRSQIPFLTANKHRIQGVNLTNKSKDDKLLESVTILQKELPGLDICVHYSIKYNYHRSPQQTLTSLATFLQDLELRKGCSVLLVSGSGKRKGLDSVSALDKLSLPGKATGARDLPLYVAFNPYLKSPEELENEYKRLELKLLTEPGRVSGVYLQMGTDLGALEAGLDHLDSLKKKVEAECSAAGKKVPEMQVYGSVFVPSKKLLAQMRFRPWNGVFLSEEYLSGVDAAEAVTLKLLEIYRRREVVPLVESAVKTEEQMDVVIKLLSGEKTK